MAGVLHVLLVVSLVFVILAADHLIAAAAVNISVPAVFVFGDSLVDTGNNNYITTIAKANFPPYGRDFPGRIPTGRFSNGKVFSDFIAEAFGVKETLPPYLDPSLDLQELLTGVSFASAATGYDPRTAQRLNVIPILSQLEMFKEYISKMKARVGEERTGHIVSESAYVTFLGSNDITRCHQMNVLCDEETYADLITGLAVDFHKKLYEVGARRLGLLGLPPTGCVPSWRLREGGLERECSGEVNRRIRILSSKLSLAVDKMNEELPGAKIVFFELYKPVVSLIQNPAAYGIDEVRRGCCATGNLETGVLCVIPGTCPDASTYMFWDSVHPTEKAAKILTYQALGPSMSKLF